MKHRPRRPPRRTDGGDIPPPEVMAAGRALLPGQGLAARWISVSGVVHLSLLVRETRQRLRTLTPHPRIRLRLLTLRENEVIPLVLLLQVNDDPAMTYEVWVDFHSSGGPEVVEELIRQHNLSLCFFTATRLHRRIPVRGHARLMSAARNSLRLLSGFPPWTATRFAEAVQTLTRRYPGPQALWLLGESSSPAPDADRREEKAPPVS